MPTSDETGRLSYLPPIAAATPLRNALSRVGSIAALGPAVYRARLLAGTKARLLARRALDPPRVRQYVATHSVRKLQIGTGPNLLPGWLNSDLLPDLFREHRDEVVFLDARRRFPLDDLTFDYIFAEHQIEHVRVQEAVSMMEECFRVLRPGGRLRIATPDLAAILGLYSEPFDEAERHYVDWVMERFLPHVSGGNRHCYVINQMFNAYGHQFIFDQETLSAMLTAAGFVEIERRLPGESGDPLLRGLETHGQAIGDEGVNRFETLILEAVRPLGALPPRTSRDA